VTAPDVNPAAPAISWKNFMSGREEMEAAHIIGPYPTAAARDADLARIRSLPNGAPAYNGGALFYAGTMAEAVGEPGWDLYVAPPEQVAGARTLKAFFAAFGGHEEEVLLTSFGYGHDPAPDADLVLDVRESLRNPYHDPAMRELTGHDEIVRVRVMNTPGAAELVADAFKRVLAGEVATVAVGCAGGRHRSVVLVGVLASLLRTMGREVEVDHRDVDQPVLPAAAHTEVPRG
jgi:RNase adapter protein RapZ